MHRAPFRKLARQHAPLAATSEQIQHRTEHFMQINDAWIGLLAHALQQGRGGDRYAVLDRVWDEENLETAGHSVAHLRVANARPAIASAWRDASRLPILCVVLSAELT